MRSSEPVGVSSALIPDLAPYASAGCTRYRFSNQQRRQQLDLYVYPGGPFSTIAYANSTRVYALHVVNVESKETKKIIIYLFSKLIRCCAF